MFTIKFTKSQAERYIAADIQLGDRYDDYYPIPITEHSLKKVSDTEYTFVNEHDTVTLDMGTIKGENPFVAYVPREEAEQICMRHSCLIGKTELITGHTMVELKAARVSDMRNVKGCPQADSKSDWAVFAKVQKNIKTITGEFDLSEWILFDNTKQFNAGIPTLTNGDFDDAVNVNLWDWLQNKDSAGKHLGTNDYLTLPTIFLLYHSIPLKTFIFDDGAWGEAKIIYAAKGHWEPYDKWHCLSSHTFCTLYVDSNVNWSKDQYNFCVNQRLSLLDYLNDTDSLCADQISAAVNWLTRNDITPGSNGR